MSEPWDLGWEAIAAVGAAAATLVSLIAVVYSARAATAASQAARAAEDQLRAQTMPVVVDVPLGDLLPQVEPVTFHGTPDIPIDREGQVVFSAPVKGDYDPVYISVPIQNIGTGLAVIREAVLELDRQRTQVGLIPVGSFEVEEGDSGPVHVPSPLYLPPGGRDRLETNVLAAGGVWKQINEFANRDNSTIRVLVDYDDAAGRRGYWTALRLYRARDSLTWRIVLDETGEKYR